MTENSVDRGAEVAGRVWRVNVWMSDDGDCYFGEGHIPPAEFKEACIRYDRHQAGVDPDEEGSGSMELADVTREWWYHPDPEDDEGMRRCAATHPGAEPFTVWRR